MPRLVIHKGVAAGRDQALGAECVVGRHPTVDFVLDDHLVSRRHFRVVAKAGTWVVQDLGSTNGTVVNGRRVRQAALHDCDVIRVGETELVFVQKDLLGSLASPKRRKAASGPLPPPLPTRPSPPGAGADETPPASPAPDTVPLRRRRRR
ncbi:MAG: FHA domain-containing protein [Planctomycetota bacterium]